MKQAKDLEEQIGYHFQDQILFRTALTHSSYANETGRSEKTMKHNERLEFLGDAVLELASSVYLFEHYEKLPEGDLTKLRASLVCEQTLAMCAREIDLGNYIFLGHGEDRTGGRKRDSITSDAFEALIGAIYLDGGMEPATKFVNRFVLNDIEHKKLYVDCKTNLQELVQRDFPEESIRYRVIDEQGPDHDKTFTVTVSMGEELLGQGTSHTKKSAQQQAAYQAVKKLESMGHKI